MKNRRLFIMILMAAAIFSAAGFAQAAYRDTDAIVQRRMKSITPQQRQEAAARAKAAQEAKDPQVAASAKAARIAAAQAAQARMAVIQNNQDPKKVISAQKSARVAAASEAKARRTLARATANTTGGQNE